MRPELARQQIDQETAAAGAAGGSDVAVPSPSTTPVPPTQPGETGATTALWFLDAPGSESTPAARAKASDEFMARLIRAAYKRWCRVQNRVGEMLLNQSYLSRSLPMQLG
jgi:hypothetical protein